MAAKQKIAVEPRKFTAEEVLDLMMNKNIDLNDLTPAKQIAKVEDAVKVDSESVPPPPINTSPSISPAASDEPITEKPVELTGSLSKKIAALEVVKVLETNRFLAIEAIVGAFAILLTAVFSKVLSYGAGLIVISIAAFVLYKTNASIVRLKATYGLK